MDSNGTMYVSPEMTAKFNEILGSAERVRPLHEKPEDAIEVDHDVAVILASLNRRARRAFYAERRGGATIGDALHAAREAHLK